MQAGAGLGVACACEVGRPVREGLVASHERAAQPGRSGPRRAPVWHMPCPYSRGIPSQFCTMGSHAFTVLEWRVCCYPGRAWLRPVGVPDEQNASAARMAPRHVIEDCGRVTSARRLAYFRKPATFWQNASAAVWCSVINHRSSHQS